MSLPDNSLLEEEYESLDSIKECNKVLIMNFVVTLRNLIPFNTVLILKDERLELSKVYNNYTIHSIYFLISKQFILNSFEINYPKTFVSFRPCCAPL